MRYFCRATLESYRPPAAGGTGGVIAPGIVLVGGWQRLRDRCRAVDVNTIEARRCVPEAFGCRPGDLVANVVNSRIEVPEPA